MRLIFAALVCLITVEWSTTSEGQDLASGFQSPDQSHRPETWFHLIGGNVDQRALSVDLESVAAAGFKGIQLFHGKGNAWPGVTPQIQTLSEKWDDMISHVADETERLGLQFTMQNCPGWAMSGGPWITPENAMRHLITSQTYVRGNQSSRVTLAQPQPSDEPWRDYHDVAVLAFPTPAGDTGQNLQPIRVQSNRDEFPWMELFSGENKQPLDIQWKDGPTVIEIKFESPVIIRSVELPPIEVLMKRRNFDPDATIGLDAKVDGQWVRTATRIVPRGTWQDRQEEHPLVLSFPDRRANEFRLTFDSIYPMSLNYLRLSSRAVINDWKSQAGYALRSQTFGLSPKQDPSAWIDPATIRDVSKLMKPDGEFQNELPDGEWTVVRFGHVNTGVTNKPAPPEATGFECNKLSKRGARQHFAGYIGRITDPDGPVGEGRLSGMLIDSWECYTQTWTAEMEDEFEDRRGYQLRRWLPTLAGYVIENPLKSQKFLRDWRATISDLLVENYFGELSRLASQRGMKLSFETAIGDVSPGDILEFYKSADIPMCEFWQPNDPHYGGLETKPILPTASAAHIYDKKIVAAEAFTNIGIQWDEHPFALKHLADQNFARGVNHLVFHTYTHNPKTDVVPGTSFGGKIGTPFLRGQTWWQYMPEFTQYLSRCQWMLQQGQPVAGVLFYLGDGVDHKPRQDEPFIDGHKFDYINQDALLHRIDVRDGLLSTEGGTTWKMLWLPRAHCREMTPKTLQRLRTLIQKGAVVIGAPPELSPTLSPTQQPNDQTASFDRLVNEIWGDLETTDGRRSIGEGKLLWDASNQLSDVGELEAMMASLGESKPTVRLPRNLSQPKPEVDAFSWCHRRTKEKEIFFVAAGRSEPLIGNVQFGCQGTPNLWDPMTGKISAVDSFTSAGPLTTISLNLPVAGSVFVVFDQKQIAPASSVRKIMLAGESSLDLTTGVEGWISKKNLEQLPATSKPTQDSVKNFGLTPDQELQPNAIAADPTLDRSNENHWTVWKNGVYQFTFADDGEKVVPVKDVQHMKISSPWTLSFPKGWETPGEITMSQLESLSKSEDPAVAAFSGTVSYRTTLKVSAEDVDRPMMLDLGQVANIAEVSINGGKPVVLWAPPFRVDVGSQMQAGANDLEIKVTNTWHNRLSYDEGRPISDRKTWTYHTPSADAKPKDSGLIGPVKLRIGHRIEM